MKNGDNGELEYHGGNTMHLERSKQELPNFWLRFDETTAA